MCVDLTSDKRCRHTNHQIRFRLRFRFLYTQSRSHLAFQMLATRTRTHPDSECMCVCACDKTCCLLPCCHVEQVAAISSYFFVHLRFWGQLMMMTMCCRVYVLLSSSYTLSRARYMQFESDICNDPIKYEYILV